MKSIPAKSSGGLGFPMLQTVLSGMELLGRLLSGGSKRKGAFEYFWDNFFVVDNPTYDNQDLCDIFRKAVRNGTAHYFFVHFGVCVDKLGNYNLTRTVEGDLNIDCLEFSEDLHRTYQRVKKELLEADPSSVLLTDFMRGYDSLLSELRSTEASIKSCVKDLPPKPLTDSVALPTRIPEELLNRGPRTTTSGFNSNASTITGRL